MPGSVRENDDLVRAIVRDYGIETVLDVGPGRGTYARVLAGTGVTIDAVEIFEPYLRRYDLPSLYRTVAVADVREWDSFDYDLVIFGDVLEHVSEADMVAVFERARTQARHVLVSVPVIHYPQGESHGNPHEEHVQEHITPELLHRLFGQPDVEAVYEVTGTFVWSS